jgi:hypothetical protein
VAELYVGVTQNDGLQTKADSNLQAIMSIEKRTKNYTINPALRIGKKELLSMAYRQ